MMDAQNDIGFRKRKRQQTRLTSLTYIICLFRERWRYVSAGFVSR